MFKPENDGIDHINIYSKGETELGRVLSNFALTPFELDEYGQFNSIEGYWFWLLSEHPDKDELRKLHGHQAKIRGQELIKDSKILKDDSFKWKIYYALREKIKQNSLIAEWLRDSILPFDHYYVYNGEMVRTKYAWLVEHFEKLRREFRYAPVQQDLF